MKKKVLIVGFILFLLPFISHAQCAMCRAVLQNEGEGGAAEAINHGITYLMVFPYLLIGGLAFFIWRLVRTKQKD